MREQLLLYAHDLSEAVLAERRRREELEAALTAQRRTYEATLDALVGLIAVRDGETEGHCRRVASVSEAVGRARGYDAAALADLRHGALLHDVGKIGVPDAVLRKPGPLTPEEWVQMRRHPAIGHQFLAGIAFLARAARTVLEHHERFDGNGYPAGLRGTAIAPDARVFAVVDAFDAMISDRVYRPRRSPDEALAEVVAQRGAQFDPAVVDAFVDAWPEVLAACG